MLIAITFNADTFHIISTLTQDNNNVAEQLVTQLDQDPSLFVCDESTGEDCFDEEKQNKVKDILNNIDALPLGWEIESIEKKVNDLNGIIATFSLDDDSCPKERTDDDEIKQAEEEFKNATPEEKTEKKEKLEDLKANKVTPTDKSCFKKIEKILSGEDATKKVASLTSEFKSSIRNVREGNGEINESKLYDFKGEYINFLNKQKKERLDILTNDSIPPTEQIKNTVEKQGGWRTVPFGWLITAIAISMGAPFWFDLLSNVVNVRNTVKPISPETKKNNQNS